MVRNSRCGAIVYKFSSQTYFSTTTLFAICNKNESCPCLASSDNPTSAPSTSAIGSDTCGRRPIPARLVRIKCEDNSRSHLSCVSVDRPCAGQVRVLLGCTADRPVRETQANFENIVRVVAMPPRPADDRVGSSVRNWQLCREPNSGLASAIHAPRQLLISAH